MSFPNNVILPSAKFDNESDKFILDSISLDNIFKVSESEDNISLTSFDFIFESFKLLILEKSSLNNQLIGKAKDLISDISSYENFVDMLVYEGVCTDNFNVGEIKELGNDVCERILGILNEE